jgi:hypothetical protein
MTPPDMSPAPFKLSPSPLGERRDEEAGQDHLLRPLALQPHRAGAAVRAPEDGRATVALTSGKASAPMTDRRDQDAGAAGTRRVAAYGANDHFVTVGLAHGVQPDDRDYFRRHPGEGDRFRPVIVGESEAAGRETSGATDVYVYSERDFDGLPTGRRHRMLLRRVEWSRW